MIINSMIFQSLMMNNRLEAMQFMDNRPPTLYAILNSIVNHRKENYTPIPELAKKGREKIFDFSYPLSSKINKEDFEVMILNKYMMRRIGTQTVTAFKLNLNVKLNEIMPKYNKLFDCLDGWDLFNDGEETIRILNNTTEAENETENKSNTSSNNISDRRYSDTPQGYLENVQDASYLTDYNYDTNNTSSEDKSNSVGKSTSDSETTENVKRSQADRIRIYTEFIENCQSIYTLIFKDLDSLFYQLIDD